MQQWEYSFVDCEETQATWRPRYVNHQELGDWENGSTMIEYSNQLGEQGKPAHMMLDSGGQPLPE